MAMLELISEHACFGGVQCYYRHQSEAIGLPMRFGVFLPSQANSAMVPALFCLTGLTCTEETFATKAGAQHQAAELGLMLITPDTSPRNAAVPGESDHWDLGIGAGFYVDATEAPWSTHYRMYSYLLELRKLVMTELPADGDRVGIMGTRWEDTARWCWRCAIPRCSSRCRRWHRSARRPAARGEKRRSQRIWDRVPTLGRSTTRAR
jgi:S-formylglutathione hydrolase